MNPRINHVLDEIRQLVEQAAWGPEIPSHIKSSDFQKGEPGVGEASNEIDIQDALDFYLNNICQALVDEFGISEEEAYDYVERAADELENDGMLPSLPSPDEPDSQAAMWLGAAKSLGLEGYCIKMTRDELSHSYSTRQERESKGMGMDDMMGGDDDMDLDSME